MSNNRCPDCCALYQLVGLRHRCIPREAPAPERKPNRKPKTIKRKPEGKGK
jgi:hypothetical protein